MRNTAPTRSRPLHRKILWMMMVVAVVPVLVVGESSRRAASEAVLRASQDSLAADARLAAGVLELEATSVLEVLDLLATTANRDGVFDSTRLAELVTAGPGARGIFRSLSVRDAEGEMIALAGPLSSDTVRCTDLGRTTFRRQEVSIGPDGLVLQGTYWLGQSFDPSVRRRLTVLGSDGGVLLAPTCDADAGELRGLRRSARDSTGFTVSGASGPLLGAYASVGSDPWAVVFSVGAMPGGKPFELLNTYAVPLGLVAVLVFIANLIFRRWSDALRDLTGAARAMSTGDLDPWLPPPRNDELGQLILAFSEMTAELRDRMAQVDRSGRLAVVGQLASYLAHEIRNPLSAVKMNLQRLDRWTRAGELPDRCREPLRLSLGEVDRLSASVSSVLQLSRSHDQPPEEIGIHELIREAGTLLDTEFANRGVSLRWHLDAEADRILGRPGQLKGVVLNLMLNALDAQPDGGELTIRSSLSEGPRLELRFRDRGPGIPGELRGRIFDPFFTTKAHGSGIGLAVASQAVREHGGDLRLEELREIDSGAEFVVSLPLAAVASDGDGPPVRPQLAAWMAASSLERSDPATDGNEG